MTTQIRNTILIGFASLFFAMLFNFINTAIINNEGIELRDGQTVITADDVSYLAPADNFYENSIWRSNSAGITSYYLRSPGYGSIYLIIKIIYQNNPLFLLKIIQMLLFAFSVALFYLTVLYFTRNDIISICVAIIYGCTPIACGFLSYTLTEGVTPAFVIIYLFLLKSYLQNNKRYFLALSTIVFGILFIIRPVLGLLLPFLPLVALSDKQRSLSKRIAVSIVITVFALLPMTLWQVRNYNIAKTFVGLHPIYSTDSPDLFRPAHKAAWNFARTWSPRGDEFHSAIGALWQSALDDDTTDIAITKAMEFVPPKVLNVVGTQSVINAFSQYQKLLRFQAPFFKKDQCVPQWFVIEEKKIVAQFDSLTNVVRHKCPLMVHITGPLKVYGRMSLHSNLSMYMFQKTLRGNFFMEIFRFLFFTLHSSLFVFIWIALFINRHDKFKLCVYGITVAYLVFLAWFQRGIEERYTLPVLPILLIAASDVVSNFLPLLREFCFRLQRRKSSILG